MIVLEVIPIAKSFAGQAPLAYFSMKELSCGSLVEINLRKKNIPAVVIASEKAQNLKAALKKNAFSLKKINRVITPDFLPDYFIRLVGKVAEYFLAPPGMVVDFFIPKTFRGKCVNTHPAGAASARKNPEQKNGFKISAFQALKTERVKYYKGLIREALSHSWSAAVLAPTISAASDLFSELQKGMEEKTFLLHSGMTRKTFLDARAKINLAEEPVVVVGTAPIMPFLRPDTGIFIVEEESSGYYYHSRRRPFFDLRKAARFLCQDLGIHLIYADTILSFDIEESHILSYSNYRLSGQAENKIIDARTKQKGKFEILSPEFIDSLSAIIKNKESAALICHRRGFSPATVCQDCGWQISCANCSNPLTLHKTSPREETKPYFLCHYCLRRNEAVEYCLNCKSWKLASYGIGIEKIGQELRRLFPDIKIFRLDSDIAKTKKESEKIRDDFLAREGGILVATELFLNVFNNPMPHVAVASVDGLFSLPDFRMREKIMIFLTRLKSLAQKSFLIQTRFRDFPVFKYALSGDISGFKREELEERQRFNYPPAADLIKISLEDSNQKKLVERVSELAENLKKWGAVDFPAFIMKIKDRFRWHIILRLERGTWPDKQNELREILKNLPPDWMIQIDPPSLL